jgi:hypothetical protein
VESARGPGTLGDRMRSQYPESFPSPRTAGCNTFPK